MMEVKGEALISVPIFIIKKFGKSGFEKWLQTLTPYAKSIYESPIDKQKWYPLKKSLTVPTTEMCMLFFNKSYRGAWECGRYSAEYGLKGIYKVLVKLSSPQILIRKAGPILLNYYRPSSLVVADSGPKNVIVHITEFPEMDKVIENRIGGWMERALEICGSKNVSVRIAHTRIDFKPVTEFNITWKSKFIASKSVSKDSLPGT